MKYLVRALGLAVGLASFVAITASQAQEGAKLYVFTSGSLGGFPKAALQTPQRMRGTHQVAIRAQCYQAR